MIFFLYRGLVAPLGVLAFFFLAPLSKKLRGVLALKRKPWPKIPWGPDQQPIWLHAASGEFEYAKAVIRELKARSPGVPILVTYTSNSYVTRVAEFAGVDLAMALPLDLPGPILRFLRKHRPRRLLIARTDLWPEVLWQCQRLNVPVALFSYTQKPPEQMSGLARVLRRAVLHHVDEIFCVGDADRNNLQRLGVRSPVHVLGDTRYDQVRYRLDHPKPLPERLKPQKPALVAGSTWAEDEAILLPAVADLVRKGRMQLILAPHEPTPEHLAKTLRRLKELDLSHALYSQATESRPTVDVLLVDQVGILAELYGWGALAFVGGSFRGSVHSVMEPLGGGAMVFVGPYHHNNREALEFAQISVVGHRLSAVNVAKDARLLKAQVEEALDAEPEALRQIIVQEFNARLGASARLSERIWDHKEALGPASERES